MNIGVAIPPSTGDGTSSGRPEDQRHVDSVGPVLGEGSAGR